MHSGDIIRTFQPIMANTEGICGFISQASSPRLMRVLEGIEQSPLTKVQLDQLLSLQGICCVTDGFFRYYWLTAPRHFYRLEPIALPEACDGIASIEQLRWGFNRLFIDCLLLFGNIPMGFRTLAQMSYEALEAFFARQRTPDEAIQRRGSTLPFHDIPKEDRYLISEMACKTFANIYGKGELLEKLKTSYREARRRGIRHPTFRKLLDGEYLQREPDQLSLFAANDILDEQAEDEADIEKKAALLSERFERAHRMALENTELYLSLVNDLDVYVATSMRTKEHFMEMARFCETVFQSDELRAYDLRYFDPTISAADSHEDKGLIECLMVKAARMLIYSSGDKDSFGKDVEAAMALCLGKPTIFYCKEKNGRAAFFRHVHPLSRLVDFRTGVAGGVMVCENEREVIRLVKRILTNQMEYVIDRKYPDRAYYLLKERTTDSIVRIQTDNRLLSSVFWNSYHPMGGDAP
ncbi:MAG: hypothetical protein UFE80_03470 [Christensenellales bacterium]|uniref:Uncharacterized protein n=1 Tax=Candidatus Avichristensenella intestinipullorum TaxID=2840693 RepID=A0A9D0YXB9_9FIRM|nr:hypothetical protein [Christensenellales bacterium]HIQ63672.1 hypothetical protein [Candidatus Avichristensenella intestinipullorum]